jgi:hypothetical protein
VAVAQKIAAILGCRLASFDEWKAARDRIHPQNPGKT